MKLKIRQGIGTGIVMAATAIGPASEVAFAQSAPAMSRQAVEEGVATVAAQMAANPPSYPNATFLAAEARGLTLFVHLRFNERHETSNEVYSSQILASQCQSQALRQYTDIYGVVFDLSIDAVDGSGSYRFRIDREACVRTTGVALAPPVPASPAQQCASYVGQTVQPRSFNDAIAPFARLTPRSEFETTAQFEARQAQALGGATGPLIIERVPQSRDHFRYDADAHAMHISSLAFGGPNSTAWDAFYSLGLDQRHAVITGGSNIDVVISSDERVTGRYQGQNSFGANATVEEVTWTTTSIFERAPDHSRGRVTLFPGDGDVGFLVMSPEEASQMKPNLRTAFVAVPFAPYVLKGSHPYGRPSVRSPKKVTIDFTILMADIQCGLVMDQQGRVLGAYPTS